jgi:hypothetical protein
VVNNQNNNVEKEKILKVVILFVDVVRVTYHMLLLILMLKINIVVITNI